VRNSGGGTVLNKNLQPYNGCLMTTFTGGEIRERYSFKQKLTTLQWMFDDHFYKWGNSRERYNYKR
jgi:hypothetical protein